MEGEAGIYIQQSSHQSDIGPVPHQGRRKRQAELMNCKYNTVCVRPYVTIHRISSISSIRNKLMIAKNARFAGVIFLCYDLTIQPQLQVCVSLLANGG